MLQSGSKTKELLTKTLHIIMLVAGCLLFGYGLLLLILGSVQLHDLAQAKADSQEIEVEITEMEHTAGSSQTLIVVLKPVGDRSALPKDLGKTIATTTNKKLALGDRLKMYYDKENPQNRIVDFGTALPMQRLGIVMTVISLLGFLSVGIFHRIRRSRSKPTALTD